MVAFPGLESITQDLWALPPKGLTETSLKVGPDKRMQWTYRCPSENCFAMATSVISAEAAIEFVSQHRCPAPPRRGISATGKSLIERMWDETDDALDAYKKGEEYLAMSGDLLRGYIHGIAECITFCSTPYFKIVEDVLRQMQRRWRMRQGEIPYSPTPGYRFNPRPDSTSFPVNQSIEDHHVPGAQPVVVRTGVEPQRKTSKSSAKTAQPTGRSFTESERTYIRTLVHEEGVDPEQIAKMYNVGVDRITSIAGPKVGSDPVEQKFLGGLFG